MRTAGEKEELQRPVRGTGTHGELEEKEERMQKGLRMRRLIICCRGVDDTFEPPLHR
jgi:hypothetical protein